MTDPFDQLKTQAEARVNADKLAVQSWGKAHRRQLIISGAIFLVGFLLHALIVGKLF